MIKLLKYIWFWFQTPACEMCHRTKRDTGYYHFDFALKVCSDCHKQLVLTNNLFKRPNPSDIFKDLINR